MGIILMNMIFSKLYRYIQHGQTAAHIILDARSFRDIHVEEAK